MLIFLTVFQWFPVLILAMFSCNNFTYLFANRWWIMYLKGSANKKNPWNFKNNNLKTDAVRTLNQHLWKLKRIHELRIWTLTFQREWKEQIPFRNVRGNFRWLVRDTQIHLKSTGVQGPSLKLSSSAIIWSQSPSKAASSSLPSHPCSSAYIWGGWSWG